MNENLENSIEFFFIYSNIYISIIFYTKISIERSKCKKISKKQFCYKNNYREDEEL